jgi:hypothetical protein
VAQRVRRGSDLGCGVAQTRLRRGTDLGCGVAQTRVRRGSDKFASWLRQGCARRGSDNSASACCKAGPSSNLGSAPQRKPSTARKP